MMGLLICGAFLLQAQVKSTEFLMHFEGIFPQDDSILLYIYILWIYIYPFSDWFFWLVVYLFYLFFPFIWVFCVLEQEIKNTFLMELLPMNSFSPCHIEGHLN